MMTIMHNDHRIEVQGFGRERVFYDGKEMSSKLSFLGSTHIFGVTEDGEQIQYEVRLGTRWHGCAWWCEVKRQGMLIFTNR